MTIQDTTLVEITDVWPSSRPDAGTAEPKLTLSQVQALLREAAAYERAQRPIVLHTGSAPVTAPQTAVEGHDGINVTVPAAPVAPALHKTPLRRLYTGAEAAYMVCCGVMGAGAVSAMAMMLFGPTAAFTLPVLAGIGCLVAAFIDSPHQDLPIGERLAEMRAYQDRIEAGTAPRLRLMPQVRGRAHRQAVPELTAQARAEAGR